MGITYSARFVVCRVLRTKIVTTLVIRSTSKITQKNAKKNIQIDRQIILEVTLTQLAWFTSAVILVKHAGQLDFLRQNKKKLSKNYVTTVTLLVLREEGADTSFE